MNFRQNFVHAIQEKVTHHIHCTIYQCILLPSTNGCDCVGVRACVGIIGLPPTIGVAWAC